MVQRLHDMIVSEHLPEAPAAAARAERVGGMPDARAAAVRQPRQVFGLMEIVRDHGGQMDVFRLDQLTDYDFGHTLAVVKAGEMLDFLDTPKNQVVLTPLGNQFLDADINGRKAMFQRAAPEARHVPIRHADAEEAKGHRLPHDVVVEELVMRLPTEDDEPFQDRGVVGPVRRVVRLLPRDANALPRPTHARNDRAKRGFERVVNFRRSSPVDEVPRTGSEGNEPVRPSASTAA